jgi:hypothetical protein
VEHLIKFQDYEEYIAARTATAYWSDMVEYSTDTLTAVIYTDLVLALIENALSKRIAC